MQLHSGLFIGLFCTMVPITSAQTLCSPHFYSILEKDLRAQAKLKDKQEETSESTVQEPELEASNKTKGRLSVAVIMAVAWLRRDTCRDCLQPPQTKHAATAISMPGYCHARCGARVRVPGRFPTRCLSPRPPCVRYNTMACAAPHNSALAPCI